jgi:predicted nucleic acid-binding protein
MIYLDSSLLVSLYCLDANSALAAASLESAKDILLITTLGELETVNAFGLRLFRKEILSREAETARLEFETDLRARIYQVRGLPELAFERARELSHKLTPTLGTRTADLLHVAAALELGATALFTFDVQQRKMADAAGLNLNPLP